MTRGNYLSSDSYSIFRAKAHQHDENSFQLWKIVSRQTTSEGAPGSWWERKLWYDKGWWWNIFPSSNPVWKGTQIISIVPTLVVVISASFSPPKWMSGESVARRYRNCVVDASSKSAFEINFILNDILNCWWYLSLAHAPPPRRQPEGSERKFSYFRGGKIPDNGEEIKNISRRFFHTIFPSFGSREKIIIPHSLDASIGSARIEAPKLRYRNLWDFLSDLTHPPPHHVRTCQKLWMLGLSIKKPPLPLEAGDKVFLACPEIWFLFDYGWCLSEATISQSWQRLRRGGARKALAILFVTVFGMRRVEIAVIDEGWVQKVCRWWGWSWIYDLLKQSHDSVGFWENFVIFLEETCDLCSVWKKVLTISYV